MPTILFANGTLGVTLASSITNSQTTIAVVSGEGAKFPNPDNANGQFFPITVQSAANSTLIEIMYCTARSTDTLTVVRGVEGTSAMAFNAGDLVQCRATADTLEFLATFPGAVLPLAATTTLDYPDHSGTLIVVSGSSPTMTLPDASTVQTMSAGFFATVACTIASAGGSIQGGGISTTSLACAAGDFISVIAASGAWDIISASPRLFPPISVAPTIFRVTNAGAWSSTIPAGMTAADLILVGAGGSGAAANASGSAGGGGGGGILYKRLTDLVPGQAIAGTNGAAGTSVAAGTNGNDGAATTAQVNGTGTIYTAPGGGGGEYGATPAGGGGGAIGGFVGADLALPGSDGGDGDPGSNLTPGGNGAPGWQGAGAGRSGAGSGIAATSYGAGGGSSYGASGGPSGDGGGGLVQIIYYAE